MDCGTLKAAKGVDITISPGKMVANDQPFRVDDGSYNQLLDYGFDQSSIANQRRRRSMYDGYTSIATNFLREEIQPTMTRKSIMHQTEGNSTIPKRRACPYFVSEYIQQQTVQPPRVTRSEDKTCETATTISETKKRPRSSHGRTKPTVPRETKIEIRIDGDETDDIIDEIRTKASRVCTKESSSIVLKRIRKPTTATSDLERENEKVGNLLLLDSLEELVQNKGSSWKRIRIEDCSPCILEVVLKSQYCQNFEDIHIVGITDESSDDQPVLPQVESSPESEVQSLATTSSLIVSLLRKTNRIRELVLKNCNVDNFDLIRIMNILCDHPNHPKSLERLDLRFNKFSPLALRSILAVHLRSSLHSLKSLKLRQGIRCVVHRNIRDAILQSLRCNRVVLESIDVFDWDKSVQYRLDINRAKRRFIFCNNDRFPIALWPLLLEQALVANEKHYHEVLVRKQKATSSVIGPRCTETSKTRRQASILYHMFRNGGPMLLEQQSSTFESN